MQEKIKKSNVNFIWRLGAKIGYFNILFQII